MHISSTSFKDKNYHLNIRKALALGFFNQAAIYRPGRKDVYKTINTNQWALISPESALIQGNHEWIIYDKFIQSSKQYLRTVTAIQPEWLLVSLF
jgi:pre-mRNA-splicing factor ATP-dependent RNA helicase DHX15/PRP43